MRAEEGEPGNEAKKSWGRSEKKLGEKVKKAGGESEKSWGRKLKKLGEKVKKARGES